MNKREKLNEMMLALISLAKANNSLLNELDREENQVSNQMRLIVK